MPEAGDFIAAGASSSWKCCICVVTYRRNDELAQLFQSICDLSFDHVSPEQVLLLVVDNNPDLSARPVYDQWKDKLPIQFAWVEAGCGGISDGRNAALGAIPDDYDIVAMCDDDETLSSEWLNAIVSAFQNAGPDTYAITGPVVSRFSDADGQRSKIAQSGIFDRAHNKESTQILTASTANLAMRLPILRKTNAHFPQRFNKSGGEDYFLTMRLTQLGYKIAWVEGMRVYEHIPVSRLTMKWFVQRAFRLGNTMAVVDSQLFGRTPTVFRRFPRSVGRFLRGVLYIVISPFTNRSTLYGVKEILISSGTIAGLFGLRFGEYK